MFVCARVVLEKSGVCAHVWVLRVYRFACARAALGWTGAVCIVSVPLQDSYGGDFYSEENIEDVHNKTERAVLEGIEFLRQIQKDDTKRERMPLRVLDMLRSLSEKSRAPGVKPREVGVPRNARL